MPPARTLGALCGIAAPTAFVGAWLVGGLQAQDYSPLRDAISDLAREGEPTRPLMTAGLVAFGVLLPLWAPVLGRRLDSGAVRNAAVVAGLTTLGVALLPLTRDGDGTQDTLHAVAAGTGYLAMAATPLLAAAPLRRLGHERAAATSVVVGRSARWRWSAPCCRTSAAAACSDSVWASSTCGTSPPPPGCCGRGSSGCQAGWAVSPLRSSARATPR